MGRRQTSRPAGRRRTRKVRRWCPRLSASCFLFLFSRWNWKWRRRRKPLRNRGPTPWAFSQASRSSFFMGRGWHSSGAKGRGENALLFDIVGHPKGGEPRRNNELACRDRGARYVTLRWPRSGPRRATAARPRSVHPSRPSPCGHLRVKTEGARDSLSRYETVVLAIPSVRDVAAAKMQMLVFTRRPLVPGNIWYAN